MQHTEIQNTFTSNEHSITTQTANDATHALRDEYFNTASKDAGGSNEASRYAYSYDNNPHAKMLLDGVTIFDSSRTAKATPDDRATEPVITPLDKEMIERLHNKGLPFISDDELARRFNSGKLEKCFTPHIATKEEEDGLPEFQHRPADPKNEGFSHLIDKAKEFFGIGETLHDRMKNLVVSGLTPKQQALYEKEERDWKEKMGYGPYDPMLEHMRNHPQGPMHDLVNQKTLEAEKRMADMAKNGMSKSDQVGVEKALLLGENNPQFERYQQKLLAMLSGYEAKGELPPMLQAGHAVPKHQEHSARAKRA